MNSLAAVTVEEPFWLPMKDGRRLCGRLFLPADARDTPVPCLLELLPYRHRDETRDRDDAVLGWYARHGYAAIRVDLAGTGGSDGVLTDEYSAQEHADALEIIAALADQQWCTGSVGMFGYSWGGITALQVASLRPAALKAVVSVYATDDRFQRDAHYAGGAVLADMFNWGAQFLSTAALPPDPAIAGAGRWREMWLDRLQAAPFAVAEWLSHQSRDGYWRRGSVCDDPAAIAVPVLAIGGWADGYTATVLRLLETLETPCKGIIGPWPHQEPNFAALPIDNLHQCKRWWDRWLKGAPTGVEDDPALRVFLADPQTPQCRWIVVDWPSACIRPQNLPLTPAGLGITAPAQPPTDLQLPLQTPLTHGIDGPDWCPFDLENPAADQGAEDSAALCFDASPLTGDLTLLGECRLDLRLTSDQPIAQLAARLNGIAPDGRVYLVTHGLLNLAHRGGSEVPQPMPVGQAEAVTLRLKPVGVVIPAGHRLRLSLSSGAWPMAWPVPHRAALVLHGGHLEVPVLHNPAATHSVAFGPADGDAPAPVTQLTPPQSLRCRTTDPATGDLHLDRLASSGQFRRDDIGTVQEISHRERRSAHPIDPDRSQTRIEVCRSYARDDWQATLRVVLEVTCDARHFHLSARIEADEAGEPLHQITHNRSVPRRWV